LNDNSSFFLFLPSKIFLVMNYTEYATAAERHLETCMHLVHILEEQYQKKESIKGLSRRESKEKLELLSNLYYLSGYVIECVYSYALCKHIGLNSAMDIKPQLPRNGVCWNQASVNANSSTLTHAIYRPMHRMMKNSSNEINYFAGLGITSSAGSVSSIPILGGIDMSNPAAQILFENWSAEVRYSISQPLNYIDVFDFFWECEKIYRLTRQIITSDYI
jgi:hypothetical protein